MCGIAGVFGLENISSANEVADGFCNSLNHRGPNARGKYIDQEIILSHVRLSIIDVDERSNQPFKSKDDRYVLTFNGELYNYKEVRAELKEYNFITNSDTEVLLAAWIKWGVKCLDKFNGMFAFAIWDKQKEELFLCRDRLGIKPLYFFEGNKNFIFSSEIRAMLNSGLVPRKLAENNLSEYLKYQTVHSPRTLIKGVQLLPPGHFMKVSGELVEEEQYWSPESNRLDSTAINLESIKKNISELLTAAVERRLISDVPLGSFLSGGIDSSLLVGIIRERLDKKLDTFAITFAEEKFSEARFSQMVAKKFNTNHHEIELSAIEFRNSVPEALEKMDHPSGDGPNSFVVSHAVKKEGITVALSGLGGDELFAGYPFFTRYLELKNKGYLLSFPKYSRQILASFVRIYKKGIQGQKIAETVLLPYFDIPHTYPINRRILKDNEINQLLVKRNPNDSLFEDLKLRFEYGTKANTLSELSKVSVAEISTYMQNVLLRDSDQMSMAHALEVRVPFLDHTLVEYVLNVSDKFKYPNFAKSLLVNSFDGLLPDEVVHRPKMGFVLPWEQWMKKDLRELCMTSLGYLENTPYFNNGEVMALYKRFLVGDATITWSRIWHLVALGSWMKTNEIE